MEGSEFDVLSLEPIRNTARLAVGLPFRRGSEPPGGDTGALARDARRSLSRRRRRGSSEPTPSRVTLVRPLDADEAFFPGSG